MTSVTTIVDRLKSLRMVSAVCAVAALLFLSQAGTALGKSPLDRSWSLSQRLSMDEIDHSSLSALLDKYVDDDGFVDYQTWYRHREDRQALQRYLAQLSKASTTASAKPDAKLAFWINAYNFCARCESRAFTLRSYARQWAVHGCETRPTHRTK